MKKLYTIIALAAITTAQAQVTYKNGNIRTGSVSNSGSVATAGTFWSEAQHEGTVANTSAGFSTVYNNALTTNFRLADDFVVPAGQNWTVSSVSVFAYQTGSAATPSPFDGLRVEIWRGIPDDAGSTKVFGDMTTNRLSASLDSVTFRIFNSTTPSPGSTVGTTRRIWKLTANVGSLALTPGTYWLVWQLHATNDLAAFAPPANVVGLRGLPGWNAKQFNGTAWTDIADGGNPATTPVVPQDFPFEVVYTSTLPVSFTSFTGYRINNVNHLQWVTANEQNNKGFYVERSVDGTNFSPLQFVESKSINGNSNNALSYSFEDKSPLKGINLYRIKQLDNDGKTSFSKTVSLNINKLDEFVLNQNFPNPVKDVTTISYQIGKDSKVSLRVLDLNGKLITTINKGLQQVGNYTFELNTQKIALSKGSYIYQLVINPTDNSTPFTLQQTMQVQ